MIKTCTYVNSLFIIIEHMSPPKMLIVILSADNEMTINKKKHSAILLGAHAVVIINGAVNSKPLNQCSNKFQ